MRNTSELWALDTGTKRQVCGNKRKMILKYATLWLGLLFIGILNGTIRELFFKDELGELFSHQFSSFIAVLLISVYVWLIEGRWKLSSLI
jgi:hypothetical protein